LVWKGKLTQTKGGLRKEDLIMVKGVIKSRKMSSAARRRMNDGGWLKSVNEAARELGKK
jgi:hypothetical protein